MSKRLFIIGICSAATFFAAGCAHHRTVIVRQPEPVIVSAPAPVPSPEVVVQAPPAPQPEAIPPAPAAGYVWVPGYWTWNGQWIWMSGHWAVPPHGHMRWEPGHWHKHMRGYRWEPGRWR